MGSKVSLLSQPCAMKAMTTWDFFCAILFGVKDE